MEKVQWELPKLVREVEHVTLTGRIMSLHAGEEMRKAKSRFYWYLQLPKQRIKRRWILSDVPECFSEVHGSKERQRMQV